MSSEWLTATEAAHHLKVRPRTLLSWARQGKIPASSAVRRPTLCLALSPFRAGCYAVRVIR
jgi:hypothetical protein